MTQNDHWNVVCTGTTLEGFDAQTVIQNLTQLKIDAALAARLVGGSPVTVKKSVSRSAAEAMQSHLVRAGLDVAIEQPIPSASKPAPRALSLEPIADKQVPSSTKSSTPQVDAPTLQAGQMQCPKCQTVQRKAAECSQCGIIIRRYVEKQERLAEERYQSRQDKRDARRPADQGGFWQAVQSFGLGKVALIGLGIAVAAYVFVFNKLAYLPDWISPEARAQVDAVREAAEHSRATPDAVALKQLAMSGRYDELESILWELEHKTRENAVWEGAYSNLMEAFFPKKGFTLQEMDQWVRATDSAWSYLARAVYYSGAAWDARGYDYAANTSESQFKEYYRLQRYAYEDLLKAKQKDRTLMPIYWYLLIVAPTQPDSASIESILGEAIELNPAGYYYRYQYLRKQMPKWGGSYRKMDQFAQDSLSYLALNPRLWLLQGFVAGEQARRAYDLKDYRACVELYTEALQYGGNSNWLSHRAYCLWQTGDKARAQNDIEWALEIYPSEYAKRVERMIESRR